MGDLFKPYEGPEPYIFVSYGRKDRDRIFPLLDALHKKGYRIWRDEGGIPWGVEWREIIADHIDQAEVCLVFWSEASAVSEHCEAEIGEMVAEKKQIVTVFMDDTPVKRGLWMYLRKFQSVELADFDSNAAFVDRLDREPVFVPCKTDFIPWKKDCAIQWYLDGNGVLTIAKNTALQNRKTVPIMTYQWDRSKKYWTAPWALYWENIRSAVILNDIDEIGEYTFEGCSSLISVTIPDSVTTIGDRAFRRCSSLKSVLIPNSVTTIGREVFLGCWSLTSVTIGNNVTTIGIGAFHGCSSLTSVTIPDSVTTIGEWAFWGCSSLTNVEIPAELKYVENRLHPSSPDYFASFPSRAQIVRRTNENDNKR